MLTIRKVLKPFDINDLIKAKDMPIWAFHGSNDKVSAAKGKRGLSRGFKKKPAIRASNSPRIKKSVMTHGHELTVILNFTNGCTHMSDGKEAQKL